VSSPFSITEMSLSLSHSQFNGHFSRAHTRMSSFWILLELRMMELVVKTGATRLAKHQSNCHHRKLTPNFLQAGCRSCHRINSVKVLNRICYFLSH